MGFLGALIAPAMLRAVFVAILVGMVTPPAEAQLRKIGEMELRLSGLSATVETAEPVVPKHTPGGVRIVVRAGASDLSLADVSRFLGPTFKVFGDLSGPGFSQPISLPLDDPSGELPVDPLVLRTPPIPIAGAYRLSNLRIVSNGRTVLDVEPSSIPLKVIDQILVTQVTTRALTLDEIRGRGIVLDSDDYLGFEFTMGFKLDSKAVDIKFPVVFDRQGVAVPQPLSPPAAPTREGIQLPTIVPLLLEAKDEAGLPVDLKIPQPSGPARPVTIPAVLVIPGNVGYLKQFFSAQLYVSNGAPVGSGLNVREVQATLKLPPGADLQLGTLDDPLALPELEREGRVITQPLTMDVLGLGADGVAGTDDDEPEMAPAQQGQVEFLIRGEQEGFHQIQFDLTAKLLGLPIGPVSVTGKAMGGVLVRNPYFNVTFTVPSVVRTGERFKMRATVTNIGKGIGNAVSMTLDSSRMSGLVLESDATQTIATLKPGDAKVLEFEFVSQRNGRVVATYLKFDTQSGNSGQLNFTIGVGERNVPLSPDTLVLPASTAGLPTSVVDAAMRVLGQAWSIANAPSGTLPQGVIRVNGQGVVKKALALAEAGLRVTLGQSSQAAVRDLLVDFFSGDPVDPGFDQLLRTTEAGHAFVQAVGAALAEASMQTGGAQGYEYDTARVVASSGPFISFAWDGVAGDVAVTDGAGRVSTRSTVPELSMVAGSQNVVGGVLVPLGSDSLLGLLTQPTAGPYRFDVRVHGAGNGQLSISFERPDGSFGRASWSGYVSDGSLLRVSVDASGSVVVETDEEADGVYERAEPATVNTLPADGPTLLAAAIIGPETLDGAGPWGFQTALVFDRVVSEASAARALNYTIPNNTVRAAKRQLSGRLVFASLRLPEGPYVPTTILAQGIEDARGAAGPSLTRTFSSRLEDIGAVVSGRVLGSLGEPLSGRPVVYAQNSDLSCVGGGPPEGLAGPVTDASGTFELRYVRQDQCGVPFLLYTVDPNSGARRSQSHSVRSPGQPIVADFVMLAAGSVTGVVRDLLGQPVPGSQVTVTSQTETQVGAAAVTDALGRYSVSGITVGPIVVRAGKGNGVGSAAGRIDRPNVPAIVNVTIDGGSVAARGVVRKVENGESSPAAGAVVTYRLLTGLLSPVMAVGLTDVQGRYSFSGLPVGDFSIRADVNTRDSATVTGTAVAGQEVVRDLIVEIPPVTALGLIEGFVVFPDGERAQGAIVSAGAASVLSLADGSFSIPVVPQISAHRVSATTRDRTRSGYTSVQVVNPGQVVGGAQITLSGLGAAEFTVLDMAGQPLPGRTVKLLNSSVDPCGTTAVDTDSLGRARFVNLPLGAVTGQVVNEGEVVSASRAAVSVPGDGQTAFGILRVETRASSISGIVVDSIGQPVFGADVELLSSMFVAEYFPSTSCGMKTVVTHRARTGLDGRFSFSGVHPGRVYALASQSFFPTQVSQYLDLQPAQAATVTLTLVNTISGEISGTVFEPDGMTSAGGGVEVTLNGRLPDVTVFTDAQGHFRFAKIFPAGSYSLTVRDPITGLVERETIYIAPLVDAVHDVRLKGKARVRVSVTDALAQPVSQAYITLREMAFPSRVFEGVVAPSNQGVIEFPGVFEGDVSIEVRDSFGRGGRASLRIPTGIASVDAVVRVSTTGAIRGGFKMPDGAPIPFGTIKLLVANRLVGQVTASFDSPPGGFEFTFVPAGPFRIEALDPQSGRTGIAVGTIDSEGQVIEIDVQAQSIGSVSGVVTSNGNPLAGVRVDLVSGGYSAAATTDSDGRYRVDGVPEGKVVVSAYTGAGFLRATTSGTLQGEGGSLTLDVALRDTGNLSGQVFKAGGVTPAGVVGVSLFAGGVGGGSITGSTDEDGAFFFDRVPTGLVQINIDALGSEDFATGSFEVVVGENAPIRLDLNGIGDLRGRGLNSQGEPTAGQVYIQLGPPQRLRSYAIALGADGRFELPKVLAGPFTARLLVTSGGITLYGTASGNITEGALTEIDVQLQESGTVTGRVLRSDGLTPAYGANATLQTPAGPTTQQTRPDGTFSFNGIALGSFVFNVADPVTAGVARASGAVASNGQAVDLGDVVLDDSAVAVVSAVPSDGSLGIPVQQPVQVTFSDPLVSVSGVRVLNGAVQVTAVSTLSADSRVMTLTPIPAWPDSRELTIEARTTVTDIFGRHPSQTFTSRFITQDLSPPTVVAMAPANLSIQAEPGASITVTFSEPLSETTNLDTLVRLSQGVVVLPGVTSLVAPNQAAFVPSSPLPINANLSVQVNGARDLTGNTQSVAFNSSFKTLDTVAPALTLNSPPAGGWTTNPRPTLTIGLSDNLSGIEANTGALVLDEVAVVPNRSASSMTFQPAANLADGQHSITASVLDKAMNIGVLANGFGVDTTPPEPAAITSGLSPSLVVAGTITLSAASFDATSGLARVEILEGLLVRATLLPPSFTASYNTATLSEGSHTFAARAVDVAGNVSAVGPSIQFFADNHVLSLAITSPASGLRIRDSVDASASTSEPVARVVFALGATVFEDMAAPYSATLDTSELPEGHHLLTVTAYALTGEPTSASVTVFVDRTPPFDPDLSRITADDQGNGLAQVVGLSGALASGVTAEVRKTGTVEPVGIAAIAVDGSFATRVAAVEGDFVEVRALDSVGNATSWLALEVTRSINADGIPMKGMAMWVKADAGITTDAGGLVTAWADQSDHANNLVQSNTAGRPALIVDGFNGYPVLRFDGNSDFLSFTSRLTNIRTVFFVVKEDAAATSSYRSLLGDATTSDFHGGIGAPGPVWYPGAAAVARNGLTVLNGVPIDGVVATRPRNMSVLSVTTSANGTANWFGSQSGANHFWWGDLAEMIVYERPLTDSERAQVETYLAQKYRPYAPPASTPRISPPGGVFDQSTTVTLASQPGALIYYTTDGSDPTETSGTLYSDPFGVSATTTVKARAVKPGLENSGVATATFIERATAPVADGMALWVRADAGIATDVTYSSVWADQSGSGNHLVQTEGARLPRLVVDAGSGLPVLRFDGNSDYLKFTSRLTTMRTIFWVVKESPSSTANYRVWLGDGAANTFLGGNGAPGTIWDGVASALVRNGQTYLNGVAVNGTTTLRPRTMSVVSLVTTGDTAADAFGARNGSDLFWWGDLGELIVYDDVLSPSDRKAVEDYLLAKWNTTNVVTTPTISPNGGMFNGSVEVSLGTATAGASIAYTLDGTEPTLASEPYAGPFVVGATTTVKAKAFKSGLSDSATATAGFTRDTDFTPRNVSNLELWWRADAGVAGGDFVPDQSDQGNHGVQTSGAAVATLVPNAQNGLPVLRFDGNSDYLRFSTRLTTMRTVFWVVRESPSSTANYRVWLGDVAANTFLGGNGAPGTIWDGAASALVRNGQTYLNGVAVNGTTTLRPRTMSVVSLVTAGDTAADAFGARNGADLFWWGDLGEMIAYSSVLSPSDRKAVEDYLLAKWNTTNVVTTPTISPNGGMFNGSVEVSLGTATAGASIAYTLDGTEPTITSEMYVGPIVVGATTTVKAKAFKNGLGESATATAGFTRDTDFTPRNVSNLQLWWRADAGVVGGDLVRDQSDHGNHGVQTSGAAVATLVPNAQNGLPVLRFDGNSDYLRFSTRLTTMRTVFWVVRESVSSTGNYRVWLGDVAANTFLGGNGAPGTIWDAAASALVRNGQTYLNGVAVNGTTTLRPRTMSVVSLVTTGDTAADAFGARNGADLFWWGDLAEMIVYDRPLDTAERQQIEAYLKAKYGTP